MDLPLPSSPKTVLLACLLVAPAAAAPPRFTAQDALRAEWDRQPPELSGPRQAALPAADRARLALTLRRIGAPGAPKLLPPELDQPTLAVWETKAGQARTPQERVTALAFLNRLKSPRALTALHGLQAADARTWPRALHLEGPVAAAELNGAVAAPALQGFLKALAAAKGDPARARAAQLRRVLAGLAPGPAQLPDPADLAVLEAWNRGPWAPRAGEHLARLTRVLPPALDLKAATWDPVLAQRLLEGLPATRLPEGLQAALTALEQPTPERVRAAALEYLGKLPALEDPWRTRLETLARANPSPSLWGGWLALLARQAPALGQAQGAGLLAGPEPLARAAAIEQAATAPADLEPLLQRLWRAEEFDGVQALLPALERWQLPAPQRRAVLTRLLEHPCWTARLDASTLLRKEDPAAPWPPVPAPTPVEARILALARTLLRAGRPVRLRLRFSGRRQVTLRLDPRNAPLNVANLVHLARSGFFNGRQVPRVVPDFVVQMGSPFDTMDGGPGYTVRCENSLDWYGPGSVGMALSGKDTGGSQFFITTNATPHLTGRYTRVGVVEDPQRALPLLDRLELGASLQTVEVLR